MPGWVRGHGRGITCPDPGRHGGGRGKPPQSHTQATCKPLASHLQATYSQWACEMRSRLARIQLVFTSCFARVYPLVFASSPVEALAVAQSFHCTPSSHGRPHPGRYSNGVALFRGLVLGYPGIARLADGPAIPCALTSPSRRSRGVCPCRGDRVCRGR
jgi:hypothetical protein